LSRYKQREMFEQSRLNNSRRRRRRSYRAKPDDEDSVGEGVRQIPDGPAYYPDSVVLYTRFKSFPLRAFFAYLREKEHYLQRDILKHDGLPIAIHLRARLQEVEAHLIWMATNLTRIGNAIGDYEDENWT
jgi:hypothetical protein